MGKSSNTSLCHSRALASAACVFALALCIGLGSSGLGSARAAADPLYDVKATWGDTNLPPGDGKLKTADAEFVIQARNVGDLAGSEEPLVLSDRLPAGLTVTAIDWSQGTDYSPFCSGIGTGTATCTLPGPLVPALAPAPGGLTPLSPLEPSARPSGYLPTLYVDASVPFKAAGAATNTATVSGGGAPVPATDLDQLSFGAGPAPFGVVPHSFSAGTFSALYPDLDLAPQAGDHPFELRLAFDLSASTGLSNGAAGDGSRYVTSNGLLRSAEVDLPPGLSADPQAVPRCRPVEFASPGALPVSTACPPDTQVGYINLSIADGTLDHGRGALPNVNALLNRLPIYNLEPPADTAADFGFSVGGQIVGHIYGALDPSRDYSLSTLSPYLSSLTTLRGIEATIWGVPADPAHDRFRYRTTPDSAGKVLGESWGSAPIRPLLANPLDCGAQGAATVRVDSYQHPGQFSPPQPSVQSLEVDGCDDPRIRFEPELSLQPTSRQAGAPTGLEVHLSLPQPDPAVDDASKLYAISGDPTALAPPPLRSAAISFPPGMVIAAGVAQGLDGCSAAQIGLGNNAPPACPESSTLGTATIQTPALAEPLQGHLYLANPGDLGSGSLFGAYLSVKGTGVRIKLPLRFDLDADDGRLTATFDDLPQQPFSDLLLHFKSSPRGVLRLPRACGTYRSHYELISWADSRPSRGSSSFVIDRGCDSSAFRPTLTAGTVNPLAGASSAFVLELDREDGEQDLSSLTLTLPPGLSANFSAAPLCPGPLAATGACPPDSRVGSATLSIGAGSAPLWLPRPGAPIAAVYLAGPYEGAPFSFLFVFPGRVGPFELGTVVIRGALELDPESGRGTIRLRSLPRIRQGIPVEYRTIRLLLDRSGLIRNPTSCEPTQITATATSADGTLANLASRFQVTNCAALAFKPKLSLRLSGGLGRNAHPRIDVDLAPHAAEANLAAATFTFPAGELLDFHHIRALCARDLAPEQCPRDSRLGYARLLSPLLSEALQGPIYLRAPSHRFPGLFAGLRAGGLHILLHGRTDAVPGGRLQVSFTELPDLPLTKASITLAGGRNGIFVNSEALCARPRHAAVSLSAHNGKQRRLRPLLRLAGRC
jgi:hypothetical protein